MHQRTTSPAPERFTVDYRITVRDGRPIEEHARDITIEQTLEVPPDVIPPEHLEQQLTGRIEGIEPVPGSPGRYDVAISYRCDITAFSVPQLFNVLYGNISLKDNIRITDIRFPESLMKIFGGPRYGIEGLRRLSGVYGRPLACTAIKPMGLPTAELARIAGAFALGGADLIKDDHGITDQSFHPFEERVIRCQEAVEEANARTGRKTLYLPMVSGNFDSLEKQVRFAVRRGVRGILMGPMLVGFDTMRYMAKEYNLIVMAHPALTGTCFHDREHGMTPAVLLGTLFRLIGADISIFPNAGGRFHFTARECGAIASALRAPMGDLAPAFPCPAGGMSLERIPELAAAFGPDSVFLIGGDVLRQADIEEGTRRFLDGIRRSFAEELAEPDDPFVSACEWRAGGVPEKTPRDLLRFAGFRWEGRSREDYKSQEEFEFRGVSRQELTGRFGEQTAFDLRYFEIEPGGYSSLEKHLHEHVIIGVRGRGVLVKEMEEFEIKIHDVAYVGMHQKHQLHNRGREPFGFFCIVDHERDRPQKV
jgi:ribulose-bisphosphate carboxylase large chain